MMSKVQTFIVASIVVSGSAIGYMQLSSDVSNSPSTIKDVTSTPSVTTTHLPHVNNTVAPVALLNKTHGLNQVTPQSTVTSNRVNTTSPSSRAPHTQHAHARAHGHETPRDSAARPPMPPGEPTTPRSKR